MRLSKFASAVFILAAAVGNAFAQNYPDHRPIRLVVPFPPGGSVDTIGRLMAQQLGEAWKVPVVVDNRGGAAGNVGADLVAKSPADGHTLLITTPGLAAGRSYYRDLPFDPLTDFVPITQLSLTYYILVVHPSVPAKSVKELIALAKAEPGKLNYSSSGSGATLHLSMELFKIATGINVVHVPYKGEAPAYAALLANEVQMVLGPVSGLMPHIRAGRLRALAVSTRERMPDLGDLPTIAESGVPDFEFTSWMGFFAPAGTPRGVVLAIQRQAAKALAIQQVRDRLKATGALPVGSTPDEFAMRFKKDVDQYAKIIEGAGISPTN